MLCALKYKEAYPNLLNFYFLGADDFLFSGLILAFSKDLLDDGSGGLPIHIFKRLLETKEIHLQSFIKIEPLA